MSLIDAVLESGGCKGIFCPLSWEGRQGGQRRGGSTQVKLKHCASTAEKQWLGSGWTGIYPKACQEGIISHCSEAHTATVHPRIPWRLPHPVLTAARPLVFDPCKSQLAEITQLYPGSVFLQTPNCVKATFLGATAPTSTSWPPIPSLSPVFSVEFVSSFNELCQSLRKSHCSPITLVDPSLISQWAKQMSSFIAASNSQVQPGTTASHQPLCLPCWESRQARLGKHKGMLIWHQVAVSKYARWLLHISFFTLAL